MQKTLKKTLSIILAVLMIVSVMPVSMAEITQPQAFWGTDINNLTGVGSLQAALNACSSDEQIDYIQLQQDIDVEQDLDIPLRFGCNQPVTVDLNGCTLKNRSYVVTVRSGSLTITDTSDEGCGAVVCDTVNAAAVSVFDGASFILENGTLESTYAAVMVYGIDGSCDITINGGTLKGAHCAISGVTAITNKITVNGGELFAGSQYTIQTYGLLTINGGTFIGKGRDGQICYYGGQIDMSGYSNPINMKIRNYSKEDVAVNSETFLLPEGYYFADADKNQVDTLNSYETYTIWKAHECYGSTEQSCLGYMCEFCGEYYGEKNDNHTDADDDKICDVCSLPVFDGEKLTIDVSTDVVFELGEGKAYYDPDGYILTGNNPSAYVYGNDECDITLDSVHLSTFDMSSAESKTIRVNLKGDSVVKSTFSVYTQNYIFTAEDENASLKVPSMNTSGQMGSVVFNGGRVEIDKTSGETPALSLDGGITINDGIVTATNAGYDTIHTPVVLNGGTLKATCTNAEYAPLSKMLTMAKGSLLILSSAGELLMDNGEIVMADNVGENAFFFVRFDTESEFAPVRDINAALAGKTYAEIKVDTHTEHKFVDGKCSCGFNCAHSGIEDGTCDICGYVCTHENWTNGICALCGFGCEHKNWTDGVCDTCEYACTHSGMEDSTCDICGFVCAHESWTGGICDLCGFVCEHANWTDGVCDTCEYACTHSGMEDNTCDICGYVCAHESWTDGVCAACGTVCAHENFTDGFCTGCGFVCTHSGMEDGTCDICGSVCAHESWTSGVCYNCGFVCEHEEYIDSDCVRCGLGCSHNIVDGICDMCGYECPTVEFGIPTEIYADPNHRYAYLMFVAPRDGEYRIYSSNSENSDYPDPTVILYDADFNALDDADDDNGYHFDLITELVAGETYYLEFYTYGMDSKDEEWFNVTVEASVAFSHHPTAEEPWVELNETSEDVTYQWYTVSGDAITALEGENEAELSSVVIGETYFCVATVLGFELKSKAFTSDYAIIHQPSSAEPWVTLNSDTDASYQWCTAEYFSTEITDTNADAITDNNGSSYDSKNGWSADRWDSDAGSFFRANFKKGDIVRVIFSEDLKEETACLAADDLGIAINYTLGAGECWFIVPEDGYYEFWSYLPSADTTVKAYIVEPDKTEITDAIATPYDDNAVYDSENGWSLVDANPTQGWGIFDIELSKGDSILFEFSEELNGANLYLDNYGDEDCYSYISLYDDEVILTAGTDEEYYVYVYDLPEGVSVKAYLLDADAYECTPIEGETQAMLQNCVIGENYVCEVTTGNGKKLTSKPFAYKFAITHQPTAEELWVEVNNDTNASYQWYSVEDGMVAVTDDNATGDWSKLGAHAMIFGEYDAENGWRSNTGFFFVIELKAGDTVTVDAPEGLYLYYVYGLNGEILGDAEIIGGTFTAPEDGMYGIHGNSPELDAASVFVTATVSGSVYTPVEGATAASLTPTALGTYVCEVTFADGTVEKSNRVEVTTLHTCDFGEWTTTTEKHWKDCLVDGCGNISEEGNHEWTDGKCSVCEYECAHEEYEDGFCVNCGKECAHANTEPEIEDEVAADCVNDGYYVKVVYCTECGEEISRETIPVGALGHTDGKPVIENEVAADCENDGSYDEVTYCTVCGEESSRKTVPVGALGHDYESVLTRPTATEKGYYTYTCSVCRDTYTEEVEGADYSVLDDAIAALEDLLADESLTTQAEEKYTGLLENLKSGIQEDRVAAEQNEIDALADAVKNIQEALENEMKDGSAVVGDITAAEDALAQALAGELTQEQRTELAWLEAELAELAEKEEITQKEIDELIARIDLVLNPVTPDEPADSDEARVSSLRIILTLIYRILDIFMTIVNFFTAA